MIDIHDLIQYSDKIGCDALNIIVDVDNEEFKMIYLHSGKHMEVRLTFRVIKQQNNPQEFVHFTLAHAIGTALGIKPGN